MRIQQLLLTAFLLAFVFAGLKAQKHITHEFHDTPLAEALATIRDLQETHTFHFIHNDIEHLRVTASLKNMKVDDAVKELCKDMPVKVKVKRKDILVQYRKEEDMTGKTVSIQCDVYDGFLEMPLTFAKVSILNTDSSVVVDSTNRTILYTGRMTPSKVIYHAKVAADKKEYLVRAQHKGYNEVWRRVSTADAVNGEIELPAIDMRRMLSVNLDEVTVTATRIKMFYRGDTLVYDAEAFKLPEGSMLDDLISQMPGVTMNENGEIFVNGRKVDELLLGSRSFMRGNKKILMENLPYYTVKELKVYEKQTDMNIALGYDAEPKKYVMDVNLKPEYQRGAIANVEVAGGTEERWLARLFALGFTDRMRYTVFGNVNNVNETRHIGQSGHWEANRFPQSMTTTRSAAAEINYHSKGDRIKDTFTANYTSTTDRQSTNQRQELFMQGSTPTSVSQSRNRQGFERLTLHNDFTINKPFWTFANLDFLYTKRDNSFNSSFDQWDDSLTASMRTVGMGEGRAWIASFDAQGAFKLGKKKRHTTYYVRLEHQNDESEQATRYATRHFTTPSSDIRHNSGNISRKTTWGGANMGYNTTDVGQNEKLNLHIGAGVNMSRNDIHDYLYHPDTLMLVSQIDALQAITDPTNSYDSRLDRVEASAGISLSQYDVYKLSDNSPFSVSYRRWHVGVSVPFRAERLDYQRGSLDTLARQNTVFANFDASFHHRMGGGKRNLVFNASHKRSSAQLTDMITYRDDSQPLVVKLGNPDLKGAVTSDFSASYSDEKNPNRKWNVKTELTYNHREVAQSVLYNPMTGVMTYKPTNVEGAYRVGADFGMHGNLDKAKHWTWLNESHVWFHHYKDHSMLEGETQSRERAVDNILLRTHGYVNYSRNKFTLFLKGDIAWRRSTSGMQGFNPVNALDFEYGVMARYTLPRLNTTLSADAMMNSRRGYGSSLLNTDDFIVNASISQPLLKGKLIARLEAFDLLHQLSSMRYAINAQGRTVTWYNSLPHYMMLHLVYNLHWNNKKK
ncbi:MAG: hypothetical protein IJY78_05245 [Bacteroidaceae bacterium]|nr:hypothetical protein [Bacteroidaceae bacterium]